MELVWNLVLAAGKAFDTEAEATEDEAVASEPSEDEGEAALEQHLTDIFGEEWGTVTIVRPLGTVARGQDFLLGGQVHTDHFAPGLGWTEQTK